MLSFINWILTKQYQWRIRELEIENTLLRVELERKRNIWFSRN